jgi:hypothetical protein
MDTEQPEMTMEGNELSIRDDVYQRYDKAARKVGLDMHDFIMYSFLLLAYHMTRDEKYLEDPLILAHPNLREIMLRR